VARRGRNEGSISQRKDGRWEARIDLGIVDGRRRRKVLYGDTRKAVADRLADALGRRKRGGVVDTDDLISTGAYLDRWLTTIAVRPRTRRQYEQIVRLYLKPSIGQIRLTRLDADDVRAMATGLEARGLSARTATLARDILRIALAQALADELIARNVAELVRRPKPRRREAATLSADQARAVIDAISGHRLEAVIICGIALGLRIGEVLGLQWSDLDLPARRLTVRHALIVQGKRRELAEPKSRESRRTLPLPAFVVRAIERHRAAQGERRLAAGGAWMVSGFVFTTRTGRPMDPSLVTRDMKRILARTWLGGRQACQHARTRDRECLDCGAERMPPVSFHGLRHSCASLLLAAGAPMRDVSELLGHSDVRLTLAVYAHVADAGRARTASLIAEVFDDQSDDHSVRQRDNK
jgi:integrase